MPRCLVSCIFMQPLPKADNGSHDPPSFTDAVRLYRLTNLISSAASAGDRQTVVCLIAPNGAFGERRDLWRAREEIIPYAAKLDESGVER